MYARWQACTTTQRYTQEGPFHHSGISALYVCESTTMLWCSMGFTSCSRSVPFLWFDVRKVWKATFKLRSSYAASLKLQLKVMTIICLVWFTYHSRTETLVNSPFVCFFCVRCWFSTFYRFIYYMLHMYISCNLIRNVALKSSLNLKSDLKKLFLLSLCSQLMPDGLPCWLSLIALAAD